MPYKGIKRFDELLTLYWGTSFRIRSSGTWRSECEVFLGDAEEERGREVIVMCASRHVSSDWRPAISTASLLAPLKEDKDSHLARLVDTRCRRSEIERSTRPATDSVPMVG
jgi:hypothetical protein